MQGIGGDGSRSLGCLWSWALRGHHHAWLCSLLGHRGPLHRHGLRCGLWRSNLLLSRLHAWLRASSPLSLRDLRHDLLPAWPNMLHGWLHRAWHAWLLVVHRKAIHGHAIVLLVLSLRDHLYVPCHFDRHRRRLLLRRLLRRWLLLLLGRLWERRLLLV